MRKNSKIIHLDRIIKVLVLLLQHSNFFFNFRRLGFVVFFLCLSTLLYPQEYRESMFLKELQSNYQKPLPNAFFVIQASTLLEVFTNAPAIMARMEEMKKYQPCPYIFGIWNDDGGLGKNFNRYLKDNYYIDTSYFVKQYLSDTMYNLLGRAVNNQIHYFYRGKREFFCEGKYEHIPQEPLPYDIIELGEKEVSHFEESDDYYHTNMSWYFPVNDTLGVELFDAGKVEDRMRLCNLQTGRVYKKFDVSQIDYLGIFNQYYGHLGWDSTAIIEGDKELTYIKRTPLRIEYVNVISPEEIYLQCTPAITKKLTDTVYIPGEFNTETIILKPGDLMDSYYGLWIKTDTSFSIKDMIIVDNLTENEYNLNNFFIDTDKFLASGDSIFYFFSHYYTPTEDKTYEDLIKRNKNTQFIDAFKRKGNMMVFDHKEKPRFIHPFEECFYYINGSDHFWFKTPRRKYSMFSLYPEIYAFDEEDPVLTITDPSKLKYSLLKGHYDTITKPHIPFYTYAMGYVYDKHFITFAYRLENKFFFDVYDANMQKVQHLDITETITDIIPYINDYLFGDQVYMTHNDFFIISCDNKGCSKTGYEIKMSPVNNFYLGNTGYFE